MSVRTFDFLLCFLLVILISNYGISINECLIFGVQFAPDRVVRARQSTNGKPFPPSNF